MIGGDVEDLEEEERDELADLPDRVDGGGAAGLLNPKLTTIDIRQVGTVWGGRLRKRFWNKFSGISPFLALAGSCSSAQLPVELSEIMLQNLFLNLPPQTVWARLYLTLT